MGNYKQFIRERNKEQRLYWNKNGKNSFAYAKLIQFLILSIVDPQHYMIMGGTYKIPVKQGLLDQDFVQQLKMNDTYSQDSFDREYLSKWQGDAENAFFSAQRFNKQRVLRQPQKQYSSRNSKNAYYVIGVDVGRFNCTTQAVVFKVTSQPDGSSLKNVVGLYSYQAQDFETQAINLKKLFYKYKASALSIDANGIGAGLVDFMIHAQTDPQTGEVLPPFGVQGGTNPDSLQTYKKIKGDNVQENAMYLIKANAPINTQAYTYAKVQIGNSKIKFLIDEDQARTRLLSTKQGQVMSKEQRDEYLIPFVLTTGLEAQMMNLVQENEGVNIILKQSSRGIKKDRFSAFIYGLYYIKKDDEMRQKRKKRSLSDFLLFS